MNIVTIKVLESDGYEIVKEEWIKDMERTGKFKVVEFHRTDVPTKSMSAPYYIWRKGNLKKTP